MKKEFGILLGAFFLLTACSSSPKESLLSAADFSNALTENADALLLDVRTPEEYNSGFIADAINVDYNGDNFEAAIAEFDKSKTIFIYCLSGGRSNSAANKMRKMGFEKVFELDGGIMKWNAAGLPLNNAKPKKSGLSVADFEGLMPEKGAILFDFYADWCGPCKKLSPILEEIEKERAGTFKLVKIDADANPELLKAMGIDGIPAMFLYIDKKLTWKEVGFLSKEELLKVLP